MKSAATAASSRRRVHDMSAPHRGCSVAPATVQASALGGSGRPYDVIGRSLSCVEGVLGPPTFGEETETCSDEGREAHPADAGASTPTIALPYMCCRGVRARPVRTWACRHARALVRSRARRLVVG